MQIAKLSLGLCAALLAVSPSLRAEDSEIQQKAREALRKQLSETTPTPAPSAPTPAPAPAPVKPAPTPAPAPVAPAPQAQPTPPVDILNAPKAVAPDKIEAAREALRKSYQEMGAQQPAPATPVTPVAPPAVVETPKTPETKAPEMPVVTGPTPVAPDKIEAAREALRQKMQEMNTQPVPPVVNAPPEVLPGNDAARLAEEAKARKAQEKAQLEAEKKAKEEQRRATAMRDRPGVYEPLRAPENPLAGTKQQQLQDLLAKYKADLITPEEYHRERAKILAQ